MTRQYLTAQEFRARPLGVSLTQINDDAYLDSMLQLATEKVEDYCERIFASAYYTELFFGDGSPTYLVEQYPIIHISSITENQQITGQVDKTIDLSTLSQTNLDNEIGRIRIGTLATGITFFDPAKLYTIVYQGGFTDVPARVKQATALWCAELLGPDFWWGAQNGVDLMPMSSEQIIELLEKLRRRRL